MRISPLLTALVVSTLLAAPSCGDSGTETTIGPGQALPAERDLPLGNIELPPGFSIDFYATSVPGARSMTLSPSGVLYIGTRSSSGGGRVYALLDRDGDVRADEIFVLDSGLNMPNGVAFHDGDLYVAEVSRILRYDDIEQHLDDPPEPVVVYDDFPTYRGHGWKFIAFGPDGMLYVPVGAPCNICEPDDPYASITRMNPDGTGLEVFARGIRNTVGFAWHPDTGDLWFTDNGRDNIGASMANAGDIPASLATAYTDSLPPDELNRITAPEQHFGYPYCHGGNVSDPEFGSPHDCGEFIPPVQRLGPHVAALGMRFYTADMFPADYRKQIFIAEHGSWNRTEKLGYRVMLVRLDANGNSAGYEPFAEGWLQGQSQWGRPVDVLVMPDGSLLVSDDYAGAVYRIVYNGE